MGNGLCVGTPLSHGAFILRAVGHHQAAHQCPLWGCKQESDMIRFVLYKILWQESGQWIEGGKNRSGEISSKLSKVL